LREIFNDSSYPLDSRERNSFHHGLVGAQTAVDSFKLIETLPGTETSVGNPEAQPVMNVQEFVKWR